MGCKIEFGNRDKRRYVDWTVVPFGSVFTVEKTPDERFWMLERASVVSLTDHLGNGRVHPVLLLRADVESDPRFKKCFVVDESFTVNPTK